MKLRTLALGTLLAGSAMAANASDYGCKVLLCLANPNGPKAVSECVPPINQLFRDLARGRAFPTCDLASAPNNPGGGRSWAQQGISYYDPCPEGTSELPRGQFAVQGYDANTYYTGIGDGSDVIPSSDSAMPGKVCVGNRVGWTSVGSRFDDYITAGVYDRVVMMDAQGSPNIIDVYVNSQLYRRVRW